MPRPLGGGGFFYFFLENLGVGGESGAQSEAKMKCRERDGSTWIWTGGSIRKPEPVAIELNVSGFYVNEDFTHPRWRGFVEGQRLDAIETARRAAAEE